MDALYTLAKEAFLTGGIDLTGGDIKFALVTTTGGTPYIVDLDTDEFLSDIPGGAQIAISDALTGAVVTNGVFDADNITVTMVPAGDDVDAFVFFHDTGSSVTSRLIAYFDSYTDLPFTPNGGDVNVTWDGGAAKIFRLTE